MNGNFRDGKRVRRLLVLETNFTLEGVRERQIEDSITCRDLGGFFEHVWSVHPFATLVTSDGWGIRSGTPEHYEMSPRHTVIEGKVGRFRWLERFFLLNFIASQVDLFFRLGSLIRRERIDVIRVGSPLYVGLLGLLLARLNGIPMAIRVGGNHDKFFETTGEPMEPRLMRSRRVEKWVERFVFPRADLVAGANQDNLDFALANGARPERSTLFRYGNLVDKRHLTAPALRPRPTKLLRHLRVKEGQFLLYVGRLERIKQPGDVIKALAVAVEHQHNIKAILAGEGRLRGELEEQARALGVEDRLVMPGNLDQGALASLFPAVAVVVSPHTGRALTEAALGACPVVAYNVDWQGELIKDGVTGRLIAHNDVAGMARAVIDLLSDRDLAERYGLELRKAAINMFDPESLDEHERQAYCRLLGEPVKFE